MAKKGQVFKSYTEDFKLKAVHMYLNGEGSYSTLSNQLGLRSFTQLKSWVKKFEEGNSLADQRGKLSSIDNLLMGRQKTKLCTFILQ